MHKSPGILTTKEDGSIDYKIINEWQLCPKCKGKGFRIPSPGGYDARELSEKGKISGDCDLCDGKKIISKVNGLPPDQ